MLLSSSKCIHLLHVFDYQNHVCLVSELLAASVFDFLKENQYAPFPFSQIQSFAAQLLGSVSCELRLLQMILLGAGTDFYDCCCCQSCTRSSSYTRISSQKIYFSSTPLQSR